MSLEDDELLAQFDQRSERVEAAMHAGDGEEYQAFNVSNRRELNLYLRPVGEPYQWVSYRYLLQSIAAPDGTRLDLVFSFLIVTITGRHLLTIGAVIAKERCGYLQQFDGNSWRKPKDESLPFIESIKYRMNMPGDPPAK